MMDFDANKAEVSELNLLINKGMDITVGKRKFTITEPYLGTLDELSAISIGINFKEDDLDKEDYQGMLQSTKLIVNKNAKKQAKYTATAIVNSKYIIPFTSIRFINDIMVNLLTKWLYWRLKPSKLAQLCLVINSISNYPDFINSIRLTLAAPRTTQPKADLVEKKD